MARAAQSVLGFPLTTALGTDAGVKVLREWTRHGASFRLPISCAAPEGRCPGRARADGPAPGRSGHSAEAGTQAHSPSTGCVTRLDRQRATSHRLTPQGGKAVP